MLPLNHPTIKFLGTQRSGNNVSPGRVPFKDTGNKGSGKIQDEKRNQLVSLLEREKMKAKMDRVGHVLVQKLVAKFGRKNTPIVTFFVEEFLSFNENIGQEDLVLLEKEITNAIKAKNESEMKSTFSRSQEPKVESSGSQELNSVEPSHNPPPGAEWYAIMTYNSHLAEERERIEREKIRNDKLQFKKSLDDHITKSKLEQINLKLDDMKFGENIKKDIERYHDEEKIKQAMLKKKYHDELELQKQQILDHQMRLEAERDAIRQVEERNLRIAEEMLAKENRELTLAKKKEQEMRARVLRENEENNRLHELQKLHEAEEDRRLMQEYAAKLDRELAQREGAFQKKMQDMAAHGNKFETEGAGKILREERLREEQMLLKEQRRKEELDAAKEKQKQDERIRRTKAAMDENTRQMEQKRKQAEQEKDQGLILREKFRNDVEVYKKSVEEERYLAMRKLSYFIV